MKEHQSFYGSVYGLPAATPLVGHLEQEDTFWCPLRKKDEASQEVPRQEAND